MRVSRTRIRSLRTSHSLIRRQRRTHTVNRYRHQCRIRQIPGIHNPALHMNRVHTPRDHLPHTVSLKRRSNNLRQTPLQIFSSPTTCGVIHTHPMRANTCRDRNAITMTVPTTRILHKRTRRSRIRSSDRAHTINRDNHRSRTTQIRGIHRPTRNRYIPGSPRSRLPHPVSLKGNNGCASEPVCEHSPEISVSIRRTGITCAIEIVECRRVWGVGRVVVESSSRTVLNVHRFSAARYPVVCLCICSLVTDVAYLANRVPSKRAGPVTLKLLSRSPNLVEEARICLNTGLVVVIAGKPRSRVELSVIRPRISDERLLFFKQHEKHFLADVTCSSDFRNDGRG